IRTRTHPSLYPAASSPFLQASLLRPQSTSTAPGPSPLPPPARTPYPSSLLSPLLPSAPLPSPTATPV
ncbi:hypothetical protein BT69DRAFT_1284591, partial [Atractiella rhizophila]